MINNLLKSSVLFFALTLAACATPTAKSIKGPDGTPHQLISCAFIEQCYEKATEACGGKYQIVNTSNMVSGDANMTSSTTNLLVKCSK